MACCSATERSCRPTREFERLPQIWDRQRSIPAQGRKNPLERIFDSFDKDRDGEHSHCCSHAHLPSLISNNTSTLLRDCMLAFRSDCGLLAGHLSPAEVAEALRSRGVDLTEAIAKKFVEASDADNNGKNSPPCTLHERSAIVWRPPLQTVVI